MKDGPQSCLAHSDPQESVNLQSIKHRIHNRIFSRYAQDSGNITSWGLGDFNSHVFLKCCPLELIRRLQHPPIFPAISSVTCLGRTFFGQKPCNPSAKFSNTFTYGHDFCFFEFSFIFEKCFKITDFS